MLFLLRKKPTRVLIFAVDVHCPPSHMLCFDVPTISRRSKCRLFGRWFAVGTNASVSTVLLRLLLNNPPSDERGSPGGTRGRALRG